MSELVEPIAVIGMAGRFPGASDVDEYWHNLRDGRECVRRPSEEELLAAGVPRTALADSHYVRAVALAPGVDMFDAAFFGLTPREAELCDPQIRWFLESAHRAVEDAGYDPERLVDVGVFGSAGVNRYVDQHLKVDSGTVRSASGMSVGTLNNADYVSTLVSYRLGFRGPSMTVQTACSSSLVAVHLAAQALRAGECEVALAGGADVEFPVGHGHWWAPGSPLSKDGRCRPFDIDANGTIFGSGVGVVVLKLLSDALRDGDHVRAVVRGLAVNNDGADKIGFSAPSLSGQASVVAEAMALSGVSPHQVDYVEAHSTGTPLGDPIEVAALNHAFRSSRDGLLEPGRCALGSVKGGVGHLGHAAGVASLIKVVLSLENELMPATVNYREPNPKLELDGSPFFVNDGARLWQRSADRRRLAGINSLGIGGTNVHLVVEEAPAGTKSEWDGRPTLLVWSGKTPEAMDAYRGALAGHLDVHGTAVFPDTAATLRHGRTGHAVRSAMLVRDPSAVAGVLRGAAGSGEVVSAVAKTRGVGFLLPGQGAQYAGMGVSLYGEERAFRSAVDECLDLFDDLGTDLGARWRAATDDLEFQDTRVAQPLLFTIGYAVSRMWREWGVEPDVLLGHSIGEFTAGVLAGVVELPDAVRLVAARADAMASAPGGGMLSVAAPPDRVAELLTADLVLAAVNGPRQSVVAGANDELDVLEEELRRAGIACRRLRTSHAFHSPLMSAAVARFESAFEGVILRPPNTPVYSSATGLPITDEQATSPAFWATQLARPVRFADALEVLLDAGPRALIEAGPGGTLTSLARRHPRFASGEHLAVTTLSERRTSEELATALEALAGLWVNGGAVNWLAVDQGAPVRRVSAPGYQYQRKRHWVDAKATDAAASVGVVETIGTNAEALTGEQPSHAVPLPGGDENVPVSYLSWVEARADHVVPPSRRVPTLALLPADEGLALEVMVALQRAGCEVVAVRQGDAFVESGTGFRVRPGSAEDLERVVASVAAREPGLERLVHAWGMGEWHRPTSANVRAQLELAFHSLHTLVRSSGRHATSGTIPSSVVLTDHSVDVSGGEPVDPVKSASHGVVRSLMAEEPRAVWKLVDVGPGVSEDDLVGELTDWESSGVVALRGDRRWHRLERPLPIDRAGGTALRRNGVYLITGGLGGLGLALATGLARTGLRPRLLLLGRNSAPDRDERRRLAEAGDVAMGALDEKLTEIETLGGQWRSVSCDVTDVRALRRAVDIAAARFGPVHGVLHLAGVAGDGMLHFRGRAAAAAVLDPKVVGAANLFEVFADRPELDFFVMLSSRAAVGGLRGGGDYAAANAVLDAFALSGDLPGCRMLSIGSPAWHTVGMAVPSLRKAFAESGPAPAVRWETDLKPANCPVLDEHRVNGAAVLPGTGHLDFVLRAFRSVVLAGEVAPVRLQDVVFQRPLVVTDERRLVVEFEQEGTGHRFAVRSERAASDRETHVIGRVERVEVVQSPVDLTSRLSRFRDSAAPAPRPARRLFALGPRWQNVVRVHRDPDLPAEKLLELGLPEVFAGEVSGHIVHPTLLDSATAHARDADRDGFHLPFMYRSFTLYEDLPARFYSHVRRAEDRTGVIVADVDLIGEDGRVLAEIAGYTMREVGADVFADQPSHRRESAEERSGDDGGQAQAGIDPAVGVSLVLDLISARTPRHVLLRPVEDGRPVPLSGRESVRIAPEPAMPRLVPAQLASPQPVRPATATDDDTAPHTDLPRGDAASVEDRLRALWGEALGTDDIGRDDDFFVLGGNSLVAVDLMSRIRERFAVDLSIAALFEYPTLGELVGELHRLGAS